MILPRAVQRLINAFEQLPGIGPKTAARLVFYLLHTPQNFLDRFAEALLSLKRDTKECSVCFNVSETDPCPICTDSRRDKNIICVVEQPLDIISLEKTGFYQGVYHVLGGVINPLQNITPEEIRIKELLMRVKNNPHLKEVILAMGSSMEGEATAMYIKKKLLEENKNRSQPFLITRMGQGLPVGADLEYADELTLQRALEGRREY